MGIGITGTGTSFSRTVARPQQQEDPAQGQGEPPRGVVEGGLDPKFSTLQAFGLFYVWCL